MNISNHTGIESAKLTYSIGSLVQSGFPEKVGEEIPLDPQQSTSEKTTIESDFTPPPPTLGRYINVWA